jgi:spoIIIJ-associated protein
MEWVETTGRTVADALDAALDELGVDSDEAEYEVLEEPRTGLFGRREARIRARVRPISREKPGERRRRPSRREGGGSRTSRSRGGSREKAAAPAASGDGSSTGPKRRRSRGGRGRKRTGGGSPAGEPKRQEAAVVEGDGEELTVEEQAGAAEDFTRGLVEAFGADADVDVRIEDEVIQVDVTGSDLGLLVGQKGATLQAIEELVRTVVQRQTAGHGARIFVDVAGYRAQRRAALEQFALELAEKVKESGREQALEPMSAGDRKAVHDAIAPLEGVTTISEGEEPRRWVVLRKA